MKAAHQLLRAAAQPREERDHLDEIILEYLRLLEMWHQRRGVDEHHQEQLRLEIGNAGRCAVELRGRRRLPVMVQELDNDEYKVGLVKGPLTLFHELIL